MRRSLLIGGAIAFTVLCVACGGGKKTPPTTAGSVVEDTAADVYEQYTINEVNADGLYKNKWLKLTGDVRSIRTSLGGTPVIELKAGRSGSVACEMTKEQSSEIGRLVPGDRVTITGLCAGRLVGEPYLTNCTLPSKSSAEPTKPAEPPSVVVAASPPPATPPTKPKAEPKAEPPAEVVVTLKPKKGAYPVLAKDHKVWQEYDAALLNDKATVVRLTGDGSVILIRAEGVAVVKLTTVGELAYVRIADGERKGQAYVVATKDVEFVK